MAKNNLVRFSDYEPPYRRGVRRRFEARHVHRSEPARRGVLEYRGAVRGLALGTREAREIFARECVGARGKRRV